MSDKATSEPPWKASPCNVTRVQIQASTPNVVTVCCSVLSFASRGFSPDTPVFPFPQKPTLPNSNSILNAQTRLNEFIRTPKCSVGKQITIYNLQPAILRKNIYKYRIYSINRPRRLLTFSAFRMGAYSRWALIQDWALIRINTVPARRRCLNWSLKQQTQLNTGLLLTGICEYIYLRSRLALSKRVLSASIQRPRRIRNWTIQIVKEGTSPQAISEKKSCYREIQW